MVPKSRSEPALPASLLLRVAEAADGFRDGLPHWFVVRRKDPHSVTPFDSESAAATALKKAGAAKFVIMGPFVTPPDAGVAGRKKKAKKKKKIRSILIYYEGSTKPNEVDLSTVDAIFLTESAMDKFVYPYYSRIRGVTDTAKMRGKRSMESDDPVVFHTPWSDPYP